MKKIGQGWQFNVYDGGAFVEKVPTTRWQIRWKLLCTYPRFLANLIGLERKTTRLIAERDQVVRELARRDLRTGLLANLKITSLQILQDKVTPLGEVLQKETNAFDLIDQYIASNLACWSRGFAETSYNFTVNHGLDREGNVVIMDFGEITFDKEAVVKDIETRLWERGWSCQQDLTPTVRAYYLDQMRQWFTLENLDKYWQEWPSRRVLPLRKPDRPPHAPRIYNGVERIPS